MLAFARLHLTGGLAPTARACSSEASAAAMTEKQADLPDKYSSATRGASAGSASAGTASGSIGHDGNTIGQAAFLRLLPDAGLAVTLLTNGGNTRDLYEDLYREIFAELADGVEMPQPLAPPGRAGVGRRHAAPRDATSARASDRGPRTATAGRPCARRSPGRWPSWSRRPSTSTRWSAVEQDLFVVREPETQTWTPVTFYALPTGEAYMHFGARATPKVG